MQTINISKDPHLHQQRFQSKYLWEAIRCLKGGRIREIDNKTDTLTTVQEEVLIDTHSGFVRSNSGKFLSEAIRNIFNKLASSFRKIYKNVTGKALLPTDMEKAYYRFYRQENDTINTGENYGSQTAIREGYAYQRRNDLGSNSRTSGESEQSYARSGVATGLSKGIRLGKRTDNGVHTGGIRVLESVLLKERKDAKYVPIKQIDNSRVQDFYNALKNVQDNNPKGLYVSLYDVSKYSEPSIRLFMSEDESVGFAIKEDEDIVSVFSDSTKAKHPKAVYSILLTSIENGGTKLDCYGEDLLKVYMRMGFLPQGKVAYNDSYESAEWKSRKDVLGEPDVYALYYADSSIEETLGRLQERFNSINEQSVSDIKNRMKEYSVTDKKQQMHWASLKSLQRI